MLSFRGALRAEESLFLLPLNPREIPHCFRNDEQRHSDQKSCGTKAAARVSIPGVKALAAQGGYRGLNLMSMLHSMSWTALSVVIMLLLMSVISMVARG